MKTMPSCNFFIRLKCLSGIPAMVFSGRNASGGLFIAYSRIIDYHLFVSFDPFLEYFKIKLFELRSGRQQQPPIAPSSPSKYFFFTY
jgi:hypothetical protein